MNDNMKNIVILKNLPSNLIDEAIVILKQNKKNKKLQFVENTANQNLNSNEKKESKENNFFIKEAENVISDYISKIESLNFNGDQKIKKLKEKNKKLKVLSVFLSCVLIFFVIISFI